jgi:hypothetical protein
MKTSHGAGLAVERTKFTRSADLVSNSESASPPKADVSAQSFDV